MTFYHLIGLSKFKPIISSEEVGGIATMPLMKVVVNQAARSQIGFPVVLIQLILNLLTMANTFSRS